MLPGRHGVLACALTIIGLLLPACSGNANPAIPTPPTAASAAATAGQSSHSLPGRQSGRPASGPVVPAPGSAGASDRFTIAFAGDVNFEGRTAQLLAADPATAFGRSAAVLAAADITMVNLETSISVGGAPERKSFTFQAPPSALTALRAAGVDVVTMANNHGADFGAAGLRQSLAAIAASGFPVVGIGANSTAAYAPHYVSVRGVRLALLGATQVQDETLAHFSAGAATPGVANADSPELVRAVRLARTRADVVIVYLHWGTEYEGCPNSDQRILAQALSAAGATAVVGTHAHVLQGAGWRPDGHYIAYGLGNYFWWRSLGTSSDDNGILTLTIAGRRVSAATFQPAHLNAAGVGVPAVGAGAARILRQWAAARLCAGLLARPPH
jgi:poly-gamma-glutamate capsule biosynthesis protein CapA/YwtB (metallophosphatase superfamily)